MKKTMKVVLMLAVVTMLFSLVFANASQAATSSFKNIAVSAETGKKVGDKVKVTISTTGDLSVEDGGLLLKYDSKKIKYESSTVGTIAETMIMANNKEEGVLFALTATGADSSKIKKGTTIGTVTFTILQGATGNQALTLVDEQVDGQPTIATGKITVATTTKKPTTTTTTKKPTTSTTTKKPTTTTTTKKPTTVKKDPTPKTGVVNTAVVACAVTLVSALGLAYVAKKD